MLSTNDIEFILRWRDEHKDLVRLGVGPLKSVKIICFESGYIITAIRNDNVLNFSISHNGKGLGKLVFKITENGMCELIKNTTKLQKDDRQAVLTVYCSSMALLVFGNTTLMLPPPAEAMAKKEDRSKKSKNTNKKKKINSFTYILRRSGNEPKLTIKGSHSSPSVMFSVRGHYRHYKNGKVIWISQFTKGSGKKKDKTYKVGKKD